MLGQLLPIFCATYRLHRVEAGRSVVQCRGSVATYRLCYLPPALSSGHIVSFGSGRICAVGNQQGFTGNGGFVYGG
jgi:hypothetical protein